ncbi:MAG: Fe-S cluster assembly ATPase SufC, partial [Oscillospiraceae bacterium]|nr:Fe-S cluster assembly ATPase SufC [Oscillospiraceae bacterium]
MSNNVLEIRDLCVSIGGKEILKNFSLTVPKGEVHALMGPNGTGKSTLAKALAGHPDYTVTSGEVIFNGEPILGKKPDEIARRGLFIAFQHPVEIPGVSIANFIRAMKQARLAPGETLNAKAFYAELYAKMDELKIDKSFTSRSVNEGFSGGEKKRCDILQMMMAKPSLAILDETDSGLDVDALRIVSAGVNHMRSADFSALVITHYQRLLEHIVPDRVHIMADGKIVLSGDKSLALKL